jgi:hypothetical protein
MTRGFNEEKNPWTEEEGAGVREITRHKCYILAQALDERSRGDHTEAEVPGYEVEPSFVRWYISDPGVFCHTAVASCKWQYVRART